MKRFLKVVLWILVVFIVLTTGIIIFVQTSSKTVVNELKKQLNSYLLTEVQINDIRLSSLKNFPNITLILDKVVIKEFPKESGKNLAELDKIYLVINLIDFIKKDYDIQKVIFSKGEINISRYRNGTFNYQIWKTTAKDSASSKVNFELNKAIFQDIRFLYKDNDQDFSLSTYMAKGDLKGSFSESPYKMIFHSKTVGFKSRWHRQEFNKDDDIELQTNLIYDAEKEIIELSDAKLWIDENKIEIDGSYLYNLKRNYSSINVALSAKSLQLEKVIDYLPDVYKQKITDYTIKGNVTINANINGIYDSKHFPSIKIEFQTVNADISNKSEKFAVQELKLSGLFSNNGKNDLKDFRLNISEIQGIIDNNKFSGNIVFHDFTDPYLHFNFKSKVNVISFNTFIKSPDFKFDTGYVDLDISYKGKYKELKTMADQEQINIKLLCENVAITIKSDTKISAFNAGIQINGNQTTITNLTAKINQTGLSFKGSIAGLIPYLLKSSLNIQINGDLTIDEINLNKKKKISNKYQQSFILPVLSGLDFDVNLQVGELNLPSFSASQIKGSLKVKNENIIAKNLNFKTPYGSGVITGMLSKSPANEITFEGQSVLSKIDLNKLFIQFRNFGQKNITEKNLKGFADADVQLIFSFDSNYNFIQSKFYALADLSITNGELINYQTIQNLFGFIKLKKMNYIQFDKIQNTIIIKDREINIPKMTMNSSAFNMDVQGKHSFDNDFEYNMRINVTKLFFGRNKIDKTQIENGEDDSKGGINVYVTMYGNGSDPKFKFSKSLVGTKVNDGLKSQKKEIKEILKKQKEKTKQKQNNNSDYDLQWDDN
jgi:hypothetical protein